MMMAVSRDATRRSRTIRHRIWARRLWSTLHGKTAVIVGAGVVGSAIGELLKAFGMHVVGVTRTPRADEGFDEIMPTERLPEAAAAPTISSTSCRRRKDNFLLFDGAVFAAMKPSAYYISAGRGQTVDEPALVAALRERRIAGAGLDVFADRAVAARQPVLGPAERVHHAASRRLYRRIRGPDPAAHRRQYAAVFRRTARARCGIS